MRVLVISYYYWPRNYPRASRWSAICECWSDHGDSVDVITCSETGLANYENVNGVSIFRVSDPMSVAAGHVKRSDLSDHAERGALRVDFKGLLKKVYDRTLKKVYWPDFSFLWIIPAFRSARRLLRQKHYDGIITVAHPFSSHVVGLLLRKWTKSIPWLCDYGDPFSFLVDTQPNNFQIYSRLNLSIEKRILAASKKIAVTTNETVAEYVKHLDVPDDWFVVIPPLLKKTNHSPARQIIKQNHDKNCIRMLFVGTLYKRIRNPGFVLRLVDGLNKRLTTQKITIDFYGWYENCREEFMAYSTAINDWLYLRDAVDHSEMTGVYADADILINIGNAVPFQLPSKIVEYVATGKPILNIATIEADSVTDYLRSYPAAFTLLEKDGLSGEILDKCLNFVCSAKPVDNEIIYRLLLQHSPDVIAEQYMQLLSPEVI